MGGRRSGCSPTQFVKLSSRLWFDIRFFIPGVLFVRNVGQRISPIVECAKLGQEVVL